MECSYQSQSDQYQNNDELVPDANSKCSHSLQQDMLILSLPREIISLILLRLSTKTLSILKCVNRFFFHFVSSRDFVRTHLNLSSEDTTLSRYTVIVNSWCSLKQTSIQSLLCDSVPSLAYPYYPQMELQKSVRLVGSCNGLVFIIVDQKHWFLWNPTTGKYKTLPSIEKDKNLHHPTVGKGRIPRCYYGFGFDVPNDDYKVVALFAFKCSDSESDKDRCYVVNVYSLKRNSWTRIPNFAGEAFGQDFAKFANGKLYWSTHHGDIVSFDVEREVFATVRHPKYGTCYSYKQLTVLGGSLCVCCKDDTHDVDLWAMKEYGTMESWTKLVTLSGFEYSYPETHAMLPSGEILADISGSFVIYNPKDSSCRSTGLHYSSDLVICVESFVPPCCN